MTNNEVWQAVLAELELSIPTVHFITWFKNTGIMALSPGQATICVPNAFTRAWLEKKYHQTIIKSLERITGKPFKKLEYKIDSIKNIVPEGPAAVESTSAPETVDSPAPAAPVQQLPKNPQPVNGGFCLNPKYTFDSFVVGKGTELAHAAD